jgi:hypothetical protein
MDSTLPPDASTGGLAATRGQLTEEQAEFATILGRLLAARWNRRQHSAGERVTGMNPVGGSNSDQEG